MGPTYTQLKKRCTISMIISTLGSGIAVGCMFSSWRGFGAGIGIAATIYGLVAAIESWINLGNWSYYE